MNQTLLIFSLVAFIGIATPGPTVLLALTNGSRYGLRASVPGMLGAVLSDFVLISAVAIGLGALLAASEFWFSVVKWVGVSYLAYLGLRLLRSKGTLAIPGETGTSQRPSNRAVFLRSFLVAVTNPKGYLSLPNYYETTFNFNLLKVPLIKPLRAIGVLLKLAQLDACQNKGKHYKTDTHQN